MPIDLSCLNDKVIGMLSSLITIDTLSAMKDKKNKLESQLYSRKVEEFVTTRGKKLNLCTLCRKLFTHQQAEVVMCYQAEMFINCHGEIRTQHLADKSFNLASLVKYMQDEGQSGKQIFWTLWAATVTIYCSKCNASHSGSDLMMCISHPRAPLFQHNSNIGM